MDSYITELRKYRLDDILNRIYRESIRLLSIGDYNVQGIRKETYLVKDRMRSRYYEKSTIISQWRLIDLAYNAIIHANDHRNTMITNDQELYRLLDYTEAVMQEEEKNTITEIKGKPEFFYYLYGFIGEQNKVQTLDCVYENAARELYMLIDLSQRIAGIDIAEIVIKETKYHWESVVYSLILAIETFAKENSLDKCKDYITWDSNLSELEFRDIMSRYVADYNQVRQSPLKRQVLYIRPFIKTQRSGVICVSSYLAFCLYEHCLLWIVRDYFKGMDSQEFTNYFGILFEAYIEELLQDNLPSKQYYRIEEKDEKRADWFFSICGYNFILEQKSTILRINAKQQNCEYKSVMKYLERTILQALEQLDATERSENIGSCIKVILQYDDYLRPEILEYAFSLPECTISNDHNYWLLGVREIEMLLFLNKTDKLKCKRIIEEKIRREKTQAQNGRSIELLLANENIYNNEYLNRDKFLRYNVPMVNAVLNRYLRKPSC